MGKTNRSSNSDSRRFNMPTKNDNKRKSGKNPFAGLRVVSNVGKFIATGQDDTDTDDSLDFDDGY